jgi:cation transport regulator ChaC
MLWVFGYGSLVWKPPAGAEANTRVFGYVEGYKRVWHQSSTDHRGTPEFPGSVVTLAKDDRPGARVWGVAAILSSSSEQDELARIMADLDHREKQYDTRLSLSVFGKDGTIVAKDVLVYAHAHTHTRCPYSY